MKTAIDLVERGWVPDPVVRLGIRKLLRQRLRDEEAKGPAAEANARFVEDMGRAPVAFATQDANDQHYELPPEFFELCLGPRYKYSGAYWPEGVTTLAEAEESMLALTSERAGLADGQRILELGCGWGSLTLWMAEKYPGSTVHGVSNSALQRASIEARAAAKGLTNVRITTCDMNSFAPEGEAPYDRVVSVEMFEHMRNWSELLGRVRTWLKDDGQAFLHVFSHRERAYPFQDQDQSDWMSRYFFTGGLMPSDDLVRLVPSPFDVRRHWVVNGRHYGRTARAWLQNLDQNREKAMQILRRHYGALEAPLWYRRWRMFFLACEELWNFRGGREWLVSHYVLAPKGPLPRTPALNGT